MIHVYAHKPNNHPSGLVSYFLVDTDTNLRTSYSGNTTDLVRWDFVRPIIARSVVYDPDRVYYLLAIPTVNAIPNSEVLYSLLKQTYPELFI